MFRFVSFIIALLIIFLGPQVYCLCSCTNPRVLYLERPRSRYVFLHISIPSCEVGRCHVIANHSKKTSGFSKTSQVSNFWDRTVWFTLAVWPLASRCPRLVLLSPFVLCVLYCTLSCCSVPVSCHPDSPASAEFLWAVGIKYIYFVNVVLGFAAEVDCLPNARSCWLLFDVTVSFLLIFR